MNELDKCDYVGAADELQTMFQIGMEQDRRRGGASYFEPTFLSALSSFFAEPTSETCHALVSIAPSLANHFLKFKKETRDYVTVWQPLSEDRLLTGFSVPYNGNAMSRETYESLLQNRLKVLIDADPEGAKEVLTGTIEHNSNLYSIAKGSMPRDWPGQILLCDQMHTRLHTIDWARGVSIELPVDEMPGLAEFAEQL